MYVGKNIKLLRCAEGWSQRELAERINVARTYLAQVESGKRDPGLMLIRKAAREFQIPVALLLVDEQGPEANINNELRQLLTHVLEAREQFTNTKK